MGNVNKYESDLGASFKFLKHHMWNLATLQPRQILNYHRKTTGNVNKYESDLGGSLSPEMIQEIGLSPKTCLF